MAKRAAFDEVCAAQAGVELPGGEALAPGRRSRTWAEGTRTNIVRVTPGFVSGRRIVHARPSDVPGQASGGGFR